MLEEAIAVPDAAGQGGSLFAQAQEWGWAFVVTFKAGRTPALWREYQALRCACPENTLRRRWDDRVQEFRWVSQLAYAASEGRPWQRGVLECSEQPVEGEPHSFAWLTGLPVGKKTVADIGKSKMKGSTARRTAA